MLLKRRKTILCAVTFLSVVALLFNTCATVEEADLSLFPYKPLIDPAPVDQIPWLVRVGINIAEEETGQVMLPARILSWYPDAAIGAGLLESHIAHDEPGVPERMLKLIRMQVSFITACPFCIDMNSDNYEALNITDQEIEALQGLWKLPDVPGFTERERIALRYARALSATPVDFPQDLREALVNEFTEQEIVIIASTIAQVNFWTRLIQGFGIPPAGYSSQCEILNIEEYYPRGVEFGSVEVPE